MAALDRLAEHDIGTRIYPVYRCEPCTLSFVADRDGKVKCPKCGQPPTAGLPIGNATVRR